MDDLAAPTTQPSLPAGKAPLSHPAHVPKAKPDPWPMRFALGASGLAALSALVSAIVLPPRPAVVQSAVAGQVTSSLAGTPAPGQQAVQYVQLQPGQTAPPGARVIDPAAPQPVTIVTTVPAPVQKPVTVKTTQSGKVIP
jgi:hypothetical protein